MSTPGRLRGGSAYRTPAQVAIIGPMIHASRAAVLDEPDVRSTAHNAPKVTRRRWEAVVSNARDLAARWLRAAALGAGLAVGCVVACAGLGGCRSTTIAAGDGAWTVTGEGGDARATWRAGDVEVVVPLRVPVDARTVAAEVRNSGPDAVVLTFAAPNGADAPVPVGTVSGGSPTLDGSWSATIFSGRPVEVPPGTPEAPGTVQFALKPDTRWDGEDPPPVGSRITRDFTVATTRSATNAPSSAAACPFRFRVTSSAGGGWSEMDDASRAIVVVLLSVAIAAVTIWAGNM